MGKLSSIEGVEKRAAHASEAARAQPAKPAAPPSEEDFHGISTREPLGSGHTVLIAVSVLVVIVTAAYILNHWFHFV